MTKVSVIFVEFTKIMKTFDHESLEGAYSNAYNTIMFLKWLYPSVYA